GMFGDNFGTISNVTLTNVTITAGPNDGQTQYVGTLAGRNFNEIDNVTVTGTVQGGTKSNVVAGGLVGQNGGFVVPPAHASGFGARSEEGSAFVAGTVNPATANVNVSVGSGATAGGLVGENNSDIVSSTATGNVVGAAGPGIAGGQNKPTYLGGLVGVNTGFI